MTEVRGLGGRYEQNHVVDAAHAIGHAEGRCFFAPALTTERAAPYRGINQELPSDPMAAFGSQQGLPVVR
jgi:hypothetical protein